MNDNRRKIGYFEFKKICKVKNAKDFGGFRIERDGVYLNRLDEATLRLMGEEEKKAVQGWHPTGRYHEPMLRFLCDVDEFLSFMNEHGLAGCIHGPSLSDWLQLAIPDTAPSGALEKAAPGVTLDDDDGQNEAPAVAVAQEQKADGEAELAGLFDPVKVATLEAMFPDSGKWADYAERAARNGLVAARVGHAKFNPYRAAVWWITAQSPDKWDLARCLRKLANNLPARSLDFRHLLTGEFD